jgi:magnesium-protoporphyrin IX monomethyl ester (oxidative) cyclase
MDTIQDKKQVRVMLVNPPQKIYTHAWNSGLYFPVGLLYVAAVIRDICTLKILDCMIDDFMIEKCDGYELQGTPQNKIEESIKEFQPDIVGISIPFTAQSDNGINVCKTVKRIFPETIVVLGGPDPSIRFEFLLQNSPADFCVVGEGEETLPEIIDNHAKGKKNKGIQGVAYKDGKDIIKVDRPFINDLDKLPFPAYDLINVREYLKSEFFYAGRMYEPLKMTIISSRGCPYNCVFCSIKLSMGKPFRYHSPEYTINHMQLLIDQYGIQTFHFEDDNLSLHKPRFNQILDMIIDRKMNIRWSVPNGLRADTFTYEILDKMKESGCTDVRVGIESANQEVLDNVVKKDTDVKYIIKMLKYCHEINLPSSAFWIIGFPGETIENMQETIDVALDLYDKYNVMPLFSIATPLYGTELYFESLEKGFINKDLTDEDFAEATRMEGKHLIETSDFSKDDISKLCDDYEKRFQAIRKTKKRKKKILSFNKKIYRFSKQPLSTLKRVAQRTFF